MYVVYMGNNQYKPPDVWLTPSSEFTRSFRDWTWYPITPLEIKREVEHILEDNISVYDGAAVHHSHRSIQSEIVFSLAWSDRGWKVMMRYQPESNKWPPEKVEWTHRDTRVDILSMSKDGLFVKIRLTTMKNTGEKIDSYEHIFWRYKYI